MDQTISQLYRDRISAGVIRPDPAQEAVLPVLEDIRQRLMAPQSRWPGWLTGRKDGASGKGCYIWGDVGRGKSMLMDLLIDSLPSPGIRRTHFHAFLRDLHAGIHDAGRKGSRDPITATITRFAKGLRLLALDEMDVSDIGDAMMLDRVFRHLTEAGTMIVTTSNRPPEQLYRDGLKRELFLPFIALLRARLQVVHIESPQDWRRDHAAEHSVRFAPLNDKSARQFDALWLTVAPGATAAGDVLSGGRKLRLGKAQGTALRASFAELCEAPLGPNDYLEIAARFRVVMIDDLPHLGPDQRDAARRFVMLVDALYEARAGLAIRAAAAPDDLTDPSLAPLGTARLASRLAEMLTEDWFATARQSDTSA